MKRRRPDNRRDRSGKLPRNAAPVELTISHVGGRGDGVGRASYRHHHVTGEHAVFVPATLPGEQVVAQPQAINGQGIRAMLHEIVSASPERREPDCAAFPACGGCSFQHWQDAAVTAWKQEMVTGFLARAGVPVPQMTPPHVAPRRSRRRAGFHLKRLTGGVAAGFLERDSDRIVSPAGCSILDPAPAALLDQLAELAATRFPVGAPVHAHANLLDNGICLLLSGPEGWHDRLLEVLASWASDRELARLSVAAGEAEPLTLLAPAPPVLRFGEIAVTPPPGAFLQATRDSEAALQQAVADIVGDAARVTDLFSGCGTLSLPLLGGLSRLTAAESDAAALAAMKSAVDAAGRGAQLACIEADLMRAPLTADSFEDVDAVIIDPPRAGAAAQCDMLAASPVPRIAMVSCSPPSFARDAASLVAGGYRMASLQVIDQFRFSSHVEIVAGFTRDGTA